MRKNVNGKLYEKFEIFQFIREISIVKRKTNNNIIFMAKKHQRIKTEYLCKGGFF